MNATNKAHERGDIEELLPWHAAGSLSRRDAQRVEDALARDPELARRYALVREELSETIHLNESLGAPSARAMEQLFAKIDAEPARRAGGAGRTFGASLSGFLASLSPRALAWSASAAVIAILLQAGLLADFALKQNAPSGFETASAPGAVPDVGAFTLIGFAPQASFEDIDKFLQANKLSIVAGPVPGGLYKVRVADKALPKSELDDIVKKLGQDKLVSFIAAAQ
jgi:hypothetical protein